MTFQPPPPPPPPGGPPPPPGGQPPGYGPPPPGAQPPGYGAPPPPGNPYGAPGGSPYGAPGPGFDPKSVNPLDWGIVGAGFLAFIFSFVSFYTYKGKSGFGGSESWSAWHGFFGWLAVLLAIIGSALVAVSLFAPQVKMPVPARLVALGCYAVATLSLILALFVVPNYLGVGGSAYDKAINEGHGVGYWITLIVVIAGLVLSLMRFQQSGGVLPGALGKLPNIGGHGPGGTPPPPPPPGYGPPAGGGGYGPPAP
ncbi:MAG: hypothetical protein QOG22_619 [Pseudonocardiales bacterium]|nr:hypothetical protein [Pseudonocardiales bacterium]